ncbi:hypothetical protein GA0061099_1002523 [Bradyrhizobium yuanmingense]|uniref:Uncharacterized protein n=1 Tax=Bradyrhizobium yuanmingense TaxID=108015 RepID=A0A1C3UQL0_9BRAD|nr:hypothetical protein IQ15_00427 [Bradyrhizobium yuanmingense]SCB17755.1 hypothetical protein GA0061099_1002523 [Bradyrhizobium yuanmingense]
MRLSKTVAATGEFEKAKKGKEESRPYQHMPHGIGLELIEPVLKRFPN